MKVLITGGAGFVGVHLAGALVDGGADVTLVDNFARGVQDATFQQLLARPGVRAQEADLLSPKVVLWIGLGVFGVLALAVALSWLQAR